MRALLGPVETVLTILFLVSVMLEIGLEVTPEELGATARNKGLIARSLLANFVLVPILGLFLASLLPMPADLETGFLLLAAAPGALFATQFTRLMRGGIPFAASLLFVLTLLSVAISPFIAWVMLPVNTSLALPYARVVRFLMLAVIVPWLAGEAIQQWQRSLARRLLQPARLCAAVSFVAVTILTLAVKSTATRRVGARGLIAMLLLALGSMAIGWILGGPKVENRRVLAIGTSMRNVALCLAIAFHNFPGRDVDVPVVAFSALIVPLNALFAGFQMWKERRRLKRPPDGQRDEPAIAA